MFVMLVHLKDMLINAAYLAKLDLDLSPLPNSDPGLDASQKNIPILLNIVFGTLGAVALLIIVISGLRYTFSAGDPGKMSQAKNGIIYALVGLAVALAGYSIVTLIAKALR